MFSQKLLIVHKIFYVSGHVYIEVQPEYNSFALIFRGHYPEMCTWLHRSDFNSITFHLIHYPDPSLPGCICLQHKHVDKKLPHLPGNTCLL